MYIGIYVYMYLCTYMHTYIHIYVYMYMDVRDVEACRRICWGLLGYIGVHRDAGAYVYVQILIPRARSQRSQRQSICMSCNSRFNKSLEALLTYHCRSGGLRV